MLFAEDPRVFTFSMHCKENYFSQKQRSNVDIELEAGMGDAEYLSILKVWLPFLLDVLKPQLIFFQAGVRPSSLSPYTVHTVHILLLQYLSCWQLRSYIHANEHEYNFTYST